MIQELYKTKNVVISTIIYTIANGNCTERKVVDGAGNIVSHNQYEFETRVLKGYPDWNFKECYTFYGKANKNLCSKRKDLVYNTTQDYTYDLDTGGYVVKRYVHYTDASLNTNDWDNEYVYHTY